MKDFSIKKVVLCSIMFLIALFTLLALCFHLVNASVSLNQLELKIHDSGFTYFLFVSNTASSLFAGTLVGLPKGIVVAFGILAIIHFIVSLLCIILSLVSAFVSPKEKYRGFAKPIIVLGIIFSAIYLIEGIICAVVLRLNNADFVAGGGSIMTYAFIPFILILALSIAYKICNKSIPEEFFCKNCSAFNSETYAMRNRNNVELQTAAVINEYGALLDKGYITREEFDAKKAEIFGAYEQTTEENYYEEGTEEEQQQ